MKKRHKKNKSKLKLLLILMIIIAVAYLYHSGIYYELIGISNAREEQYQEPVLPTPDDIGTVPTGELIVSFIDVGQGDATLIRSENHVILIDTGSRSARDQVKNTLNSKGVETIDLMILTHQHEDHIGNASMIMNYFEVLEVKYPEAGYDLVETLVWQRALESIEYHNVEVSYPSPGQYRKFDDIRIDVLGPLPEMRGVNNNSIILRLTHGNKSFMFSGDAEREAENALVNAGVLREANVMLVGHHGSNTSATEVFINAINPTYAIISVGANNRYRHPHDNVLNRLQEHNILVRRTDELGTIKVVSNGNELNFVY